MAVKFNTPADGAATAAAVARPIPSSAGLAGFALPTKKSVASMNLADYILFIYGQKKIGKTTLLAQFPNALHLFCELGGKGIDDVYGLTIENWHQVLKTVELLGTDQGDLYDNIIVDTADKFFDYCFEHVVKFDIGSHPGEVNDFGASWKKIKDEFKRVVDAMSKLGKGVVFISHAKEVEIKTRFQGNYTKIIPTLSNQAMEFLTGFTDMNACYSYVGDKRWLIIDGSENIETGVRRMGKKAFRTPDGDKIVAIPMFADDKPDFDAEDAYEMLMRAFRGEQEETYSEVHTDPTRLTEFRVALKAKPTAR